MVIFTVNISDDIERSLGRLFCQQFAGTKKQQTTPSPHCEFRRSTDPPKELLSLGICNQSLGICAGYLSFTFFSSLVQKSDEQGRERATELMVNFFPYLDKHIKSTKSYMHTRMRNKKDDLLKELKEVALQKNKNKKKTTTKNAFGMARRLQVGICS
jgi:actin related protein 2/3 complex, subunit 2